jgi:mRNA-degrading endonuclease RelE of RelBE toxin-antitoxin system
MWRIEYTKRFLKDLASLPNTVRDRAEAIANQSSAHRREIHFLMSCVLQIR